MDEYAIIFRSWVWLSPPQPPIAMDNIDMVRSRSRLIVGEIWYKIDIGASFCQVNRIKPDESLMPCVTSGTQKWNGDKPSFIARASVIMVDEVGSSGFVVDHWPE